MKPASLLILLASLLTAACGDKRPAPGTSTPSVSADAPRTSAARSGVEPDTTPEGTLERFLRACIQASSADPAVRADALRDIQALTHPILKDDDWTKRPTNRTFVQRLQSHPWIFRSYAPGATPDNAYAAPATFSPDITSRREEAGLLKLWIRSGGADSPRPVSLVRPEGSDRRYIQEWSSLYVEIRPPK